MSRKPTTDLGRKRYDAGLSRQDVAAEAGCSVSQITYFESRDGQPGRKFSSKFIILQKIYGAMQMRDPDHSLRQWLRAQAKAFRREHEQCISDGNGGNVRCFITDDDLCEFGMLIIKAKHYQHAVGQRLNPVDGHQGKEK